MRWIFLSLGLVFFVASLFAQEQENKLVDRLLRPDMSLTNSAQNKKFAGDGRTFAEKKFVTESSYPATPATTKTFQGEKKFAAKEFPAQKFSRADNTANSSSGTIISKADTKYATQQSATIRSAPEAGKVAPVRDYPGQRPFLAKGKSQKALNRKNKPLTIDEVREVLNKNK